MAPYLKPLPQQTLVITGASSGIGLATARRAAFLGARVVIVSRNLPALEDIALELDPSGQRVLPVAADVGIREDVERVAQAAIARFGSYDTWVNNAGVAIWGRLTAGSEADYRRLFDTNFWGTVHGSLIAAQHLARHGGALINVGSITGDRAWPLQGMYCASKHAIQGFTDCLRMELEEARAPVSVTLIKPAAVGTPLLRHAHNYTGRPPQLPPPIYAPEEVAHAILHAAQHRVRDIYVGGAGRIASSVGHHAPRLTDWISEAALFSAQMGSGPASVEDSNLYRPGSAGEVRGDHGRREMQTSYYTRANLRPALPDLARRAADSAATALAERWRGGGSR
ncbi:SDR family oxidoreductase [Caldimonas brevitalea]|uniref:Short-chain dehydrogenase n=1 Tax=Caldimonas brevitalea TaxID=413882 RepID=A0A0G3BIP9_9BURK|nr:SDR family oxidoreductase [Caldimonas brevitalea]AKJ27853.1 short-chain dehydrogenase [Caldimonas brevitalea]